jgi:internalin A
MTPDEAYEEARRRIRRAEETGALELDLSGWKYTLRGYYTGLEFLTRMPPELARLTSLQSLNLDACQQLSGDLSPLASLTSLQTLNLSWCNQLSDLSPLSGLTKLQTLDLSWCKHLSGDLSPLAGFTSLQSLEISDFRYLSGYLATLGGLTSLQLVYDSDFEQLSDLSQLAGLTSLQSLSISRCEQLSDFSPLTRLPSLQSLSLSECEQLSDFSQLASIISLKSLRLYRCERLSSNLAPLTALTSLKWLRLAACERLSGDLAPLADLISLEGLEFSEPIEFSDDLSPLTDLTSLHSLILYGCWQLRGDLSPLANLTSLQSLNLYRCWELSRDLSPLAALTSLQSLSLSKWQQLSDLSPLTDLTSLQELDLSECGQLSDLSPLASLTSLKTLRLSGCLGIRRFAPLESLLPRLEYLSLPRCQLYDLPPEICGEECLQNVLHKVRAHYEDLKSGQQIDAEVKVLFLGNGGVGKTQLCRRLHDLPFDPNISTTHGVQLGEMAVTLESFPEPVRLNLWDFGGQDIYHGSHSLFLHGQAIFLLLWTPELEHQATYQEGGLTLRHRPLSYWVDYLRAFAGTDASVLIVQSQCDTREKRVLHPTAPVDDFPFHRFTEVSARTGLNLGILKESIKEDVRARFDRRPPPPIGIGRLKVRNRLRAMLEEDQQREPEKRQHRLLERAEFDRVCDEIGGVRDKLALLNFLHHNGVVFYRPGLFGDRIVLDQNWALEAIYALFDRKKILPLLRGYGRFSRSDLEALIWSNHTPKEQEVFLGMMESCGICFKVREISYNEWEYIAPELLPEWSDAQEQLLGRLRDDTPDAETTARYAFLHEGVLRDYLSKLGQQCKDTAIYWKYGCWFYEQTTRSQVLIESQWEDAASEAGAGKIRFRAWGKNAVSLIDPLLDPLRKLRVGQAPKIEQTKRIRFRGFISSFGLVVSRLVQNLLTAKDTPKIFVSFAWGDDSSQEARQRTEVVDRLCKTLEKYDWHILRDSNVLRPGDLISGFMKRIGLSDHVIVVLSNKYLRSPYCMTELHYIYQNSRLEKQEFLDRIIPLVLDDARFGTPEERVEYAKHWEARYLKLKSDLDHLSVEDFRLYKSMQKWHLDIGEILAYVNDILVPSGFDEIVKDDFASLRQMLQQRR